tara:strand:- start:350 stop:610 length:261 start_codon:yes stop_codon:yes gene_type:complete
LIVEEELSSVESVLDPESVPEPVLEPVLDPVPAEPEDEPEEPTDGVELPPPPPPHETSIKKIVIKNIDPYFNIISPNLSKIILLYL